MLLSLVMITVYFRESDGGALHELQDAGATVLSPFQVAAERVARPFRDVYGYVDGLVDAKAENERLRAENRRLRQASIQDLNACQQNLRLRALLAYRDGPRFPDDYRGVATRVLVPATSRFDRRIVLAAGSSDGIRVDDPVVTGDGLVGRVTSLAPHTAQVTLLTDSTSSVAAFDLRTGAPGIVEHGEGESLVLDRVAKEQVVSRGDVIVTAGSPNRRLRSLYPRWIQIGVVTSVNQTDTDLYKRVQIEPFVDFGALDDVLVLVPKGRAAARAR